MPKILQVEEIEIFSNSENTWEKIESLQVNTIFSTFLIGYNWNNCEAFSIFFRGAGWTFSFNEVEWIIN